jgi:Ca-activated chloride channel homolog
MSLLTPTWLLLGLLALPILVLYMLKLRRREVKVSSILLWQALLRDRQANAPWQKIKRNLLLFLQLLILAALVLSLARPALQVPTVASGMLVVLLDASASMTATDVPPSRFEAARSAALSLVENMESGSKITLIQVSRQPQILASAESDRAVLAAKIQQAKVTAEEADWETAIALAAGAISGAVPAIKQATATVVVISDGGLPEQGLPPLPAEIKFIPIGSGTDNLAISALALRPAGQYSELFASVSNYGQAARTVVLSLYLDDELYDARLTQIDAGKTEGIILDNFPAQNGIVMAKISAPDSEDPGVDDLTIDNTAFAINQTAMNRRVLLVTPGNFFLDQLLASFPGLLAYKALSKVDENGIETSQFSLPQENFNLYVLDQTLPTEGSLDIPELPEGNLLLIDPPSNALFSVTGVFSPNDDVQVRDHRLTEFLDWSSVHIREARKVQLPIWAEVLVDSPDGPLVFAGETEGRRVAVLTFDLHDSDLPLQIAFPILFASLMDYLIPSQAIQEENSILPGDGLEIRPPPGTQIVAIASPSGNVYSLAPTDNGFYFSETQELGVYGVNYLEEETQSYEYFTVNLFSPFESNIHPVDNIQIGRSAIPASEQEALGLRETWPWVAVVALIILVIEWWVYHRRQIVSGNRIAGWFLKRRQA